MTDFSEKTKRSVQMCLFILIVMMTLFGVAYALLGHAFVRAIYEGKSFGIIDGIFEGRSLYPVEHYIEGADALVKSLVKAAVLVSVVIFVLVQYQNKIQEHARAVPYILTGLLSLVGWLLFYPAYHNMDDGYHRLLLENLHWYGYEGSDAYMMLFFHPALSWILSRLYSLAPDIYWHDLTLWAANFISCIALITMAAEKRIGWVLFCIPFISVFYLLPMLVKLEFSTSAVLATGTGALLLLFSVSGKGKTVRISYRKVLTSLVLILLGCLIRTEGAVLTILFFFIVILPVSFPRFPGRREKSVVLCLLVAMIGIAGIFMFMRSVMLPESVEQFWTLNFHRSYLTEMNEDILDRAGEDVQERAGWSPNDLSLFKNTILLNPETFSSEKLRKARDAVKDWKKENFSTIFSLKLKRGLSFLNQWYYPYSFLLILLIGVAFFSGTGYARILYVIASLIAMYCVIGFFTKPVPNRLSLGFLTVSTFGILAFANEPRLLAKKKYINWGLAVFCVLLVFKGTFVFGMNNQNRERVLQRTVKDVKKMMIISRPDILAIRGELNLHAFYKPFTEDPVPDFSRTPAIRVNQRALSPQGITYVNSISGYSDTRFLCIRNRKVLLITDRANLQFIEKELQEHFGLNTSFEPVFEGEVFSAFTCTIN